MGAGPSIKYVQISSQILRSRQSAILWRDARQNWVVRDWLFSWDWLLGTGCQGLVGRDWLVGLCFEDWLLGNGCYRGTGCLGLAVWDWLLGIGYQGLAVRDWLLGIRCQGQIVRDQLLGTGCQGLRSLPRACRTLRCWRQRVRECVCFGVTLN